MRRTICALLMTLAVALTALSKKDGLPPAVASLAETEREFARYSVAHGQPEAWIEFFADDGVIFQPEPLNAREVMRKRLPTPQPPPATLYWEPYYGDASLAGDLGFNVGPWKLSDNTAQKRPSRHGYFLSVWKRQPDGKWKEVADLGVGVPSPTKDHDFGQPFRRASGGATKPPKTATDLEAGRRMILDTEREFSDATTKGDAADAYLKYLDDGAIVLRDAQAPAVGKDSARTLLPRGSLSFTPLRADFSSSADFGYAYGSYELKEGARVKEKGYYLRVWRLDARGRWKIAADSNTGPQ